MSKIAEIFDELSGMLDYIKPSFDNDGFPCEVYRDSNFQTILQFDKIPFFIYVEMGAGIVKLKDPEFSIVIDGDTEDIQYEVETFISESTRRIVENFR